MGTVTLLGPLRATGAAAGQSAGPVPLARSGSLPPAAPAPPPQPKMRIAAGKLSVVLPLAPLPTSHGGFGWTFTGLDRGGRKPVNLPVSPQARTLSFAGMVIGFPDHQTPIDAILARLEALAGSKAKLAISYARPERGVWYLTGLSYEVTMRAAGTNTPTRATATLDFVEAVDLPRVIGPTRPGKGTGSPAKPSPPKTSTPVGRYYVVRAGDTLFAIAARYYGNGALWPRIADANGIRDARAVRVGMRLRIP